MPSKQFISAVGRNLDFKWYPDPAIIADGLEQAATKLNTTMDVPLEASVQIIMENVKGRFEDEGPGWAPWAYEGAQGPAAKYSRTYKGKGTLMQSSGETFAHTQHEGSYAVVGNTVQYIPMGIVDEIAHSHGPYKRNIWFREYMGLTDAGTQDVTLIFAEWLEALMKGAVPAGSKPSGTGISTYTTKSGAKYEQPRSTLGTFLPGRRRIG